MDECWGRGRECGGGVFTRLGRGQKKGNIMDSCVCGEHNFYVKINPRQHVRMADFCQIRPERFPVRNGSRVPARRKGRTSGMLRPDSAGIRPEQESCPGFCHPKNGNENRNVQPRLASTVMIVMIAITASRCRQSPVRLGDCALISQSVEHEILSSMQRYSH